MAIGEVSGEFNNSVISSTFERLDGGGSQVVINIEGNGTGADWTDESLTLPADDVGGKTIKIEFQFVSNSDADLYGGFYIDDVEVTLE